MPPTASRPQVVLITGASSGIGRACAEHLHARGYRVYGTSRGAAWPTGHPPDNARAVGQASSLPAAASSRPAGSDVGQASSLPYTLVPLDVTSDESVGAAIQVVLDREGAIDVVVNNAGFGIAGAVEDTPADEARAQLETNFFGTVRVCRAVLPAMRREGAGCIVNISSIAGLVGIPFQALYSASKFAVEGFTEALRMEVAPFGIRVALVEPGDFRTGFTANRRVVAGTSDAYRDRRARAVGVMEHDETHGPDPVAVARLVHRIVTLRSPRLRYSVGPASERLVLMLKRFVPARLFERGIAAYYRVR
jgi:NAD(P)-dependent dehydrogenase (short-subunit alcohol dehydrogenase family)